MHPFPFAAVAVAGNMAVGGVAAVVGAGDGSAWPIWIALPANLFAIALLLYLVLTGKLYRAEDMDRAIAGERDRSDERVAAEHAKYIVLQERMSAVISDRDAWRLAHSAEVDARKAAEESTRRLVNSTEVTTQLLQALEAALSRAPH